jgi:hypothetical protein
LGGGGFSFNEKGHPTFSSPFLFIKYSKTTYQNHHIHIQNMKKMGHIFDRKKIMRYKGIKKKKTLKCKKKYFFYL